MNSVLCGSRILIFAESLPNPLATMLENWSGGSDIVDNEDVAYHLLSSGQYRILCGVAPGTGVIGLCRAVKSSERLRSCPVVVVSSSETESPEPYLSAGAESFLVNPSQQVFAAQIVSTLRNRTYLSGSGPVFPACCNVQSRDEAFISRLRNFISSNIKDPDLSVSRLASAMNMSPSNLFRRVREALGMSPNVLVNEMRLSKAKELLDGNEKEISEIVFYVGFNSHSYFSKCFKVRYGMSPTEYLNGKNEDIRTE